jgi:Fe-S cluster assembly ATP-binding protein
MSKSGDDALSKRGSGGLSKPELVLSIRDLHARVEGKEILRGINLDVRAGEVHAIMGPNASGKSTLAGVLTGRDAYEVTAGSVTFIGRDLLAMAPEERAREGVFLSFQYPVEIPGVTTAYFLKSAVNSVRKHQGREELDAMDFLKLAREKMKLVDMNEQLLNRPLNEGFSGGEKKRNEIFQMAMLEPRFAILDETDSGLDIDALRVVAKGVNSLRAPERAIVMVTHYQRLLDYIVPDFTHVLAGGRIVLSGGADLAREVEEKGYAWIEQIEKGATAAAS